MENWNKYYKGNNEKQEDVLSPEDVVEVSDEQVAEYINRISGINEITGFAKAEISYQAYNLSDEEDSNRERVYNVANATIQISRNSRFADLFVVDIIFKSADSTELKLLWGRLQKHLQCQSQKAEDDWIFYINLLERASITNQTYTRDSILTANIINPMLSYLTREIPNQRVQDSLVNGELLGGNIVRLLVPTTLLTFSLIDNIDTNELKGEVQRDYDSALYLEGVEANE